MRGFLLAAVMFGAASGAQAADMPDFLRGSLPAGPAPTVNWQGYYIGAQAGYGSSDENLSGSNATMLAALLDHNVIEEMQVSQWNLGLGKRSARSSAFGAFTGYNWQWDDTVLGLEASYMHGSFGGAANATKSLTSGAALSDKLFHQVAVDSSSSISISDMVTFRGRAAYAWSCFLPYVFGGFALGNADISRTATVLDVTTPGPPNPPAQPASPPALPPTFGSAAVAQHNHLIYGYSAGLGVDMMLYHGLFARAEWEYVRFTTSVDTSINTVRLGLGYKF